MNAKVEKLENGKVKLEITVEADKFEEGLQKAFFRNAKHFNVPGFRKGKAPRTIVEKHYGESVLYEDAFNIIVPELYDEVIKENNIDAVTMPDIDITQIGKDKDLIFTATVTVKPEVKLGKYKGIKIEKKEYKVTSEDIANKVNEMADKNARMVTASEDKGAEKGNVAVIDFEGFVDGIPFDGGKAENHSLEIGSGSFIPGFEDQVVGMKTGEERDVKVKFPEEYFEKALAGKDAIFKVKLNELKIKEMPKVDDEFAKDVSEYDTLKELQDSIKEELEAENEKRAKYEEEEEAIKIVVEATTIDIPREMIDIEIDDYIKDFENRLSYQGMNLDTYMNLVGKDIVSIRKEYEEKAEKNVKVKLTLEAIFKAENIEITDEDINNKLSEAAKAYGRDADEFVKKATNQMKEYVREELKYDKAVNFIMINAK